MPSDIGAPTGLPAVGLPWFDGPQHLLMRILHCH